MVWVSTVACFIAPSAGATSVFFHLSVISLMVCQSHHSQLVETENVAWALHSDEVKWIDWVIITVNL